MNMRAPAKNVKCRFDPFLCSLRAPAAYLIQIAGTPSRLAGRLPTTADTPSSPSDPMQRSCVAIERSHAFRSRESDAASHSLEQGDPPRRQPPRRSATE